MKNLTLIILCFFGLNIIAQKTIVIEGKDNKDNQVINKLKKQEIIVKVDGEPINAKITEIKTEPTQEDIRKLTPQLAKSVADLKKYNSHELEIQTLKNEKIELENKIKTLESGNSTELRTAKDKLEICESQSKNAQKNQAKLAQEEKFTKDMINKCLEFKSKEVPKEIRDLLISSAGNLNLSEDKRKLERYNSHVAKMKSATNLLSKPYNKIEISNKITTLNNSGFKKLDDETDVIKETLKKYCKYNNDLLLKINEIKNIPNDNIRNNNLKSSRVYRKIKELGYVYLTKQAYNYLDNKSHNLKKQSCPN